MIARTRNKKHKKHRIRHLPEQSCRSCRSVDHSCPSVQQSMDRSVPDSFNRKFLNVPFIPEPLDPELSGPLLPSSSAHIYTNMVQHTSTLTVRSQITCTPQRSPPLTGVWLSPPSQMWSWREGPGCGPTRCWWLYRTA